MDRRRAEMRVVMMAVRMVDLSAYWLAEMKAVSKESKWAEQKAEQKAAWWADLTAAPLVEHLAEPMVAHLDSM